jgi:hypothetical protein
MAPTVLPRVRRPAALDSSATSSWSALPSIVKSIPDARQLGSVSHSEAPRAPCQVPMRWSRTVRTRSKLA